MADHALIEELRAQGLKASPAQLERWRAAGLLPKPTLTRLGAHGTSTAHPPGTLPIAVALARASHRRLSASALTMVLLVESLPVSDELLVTSVRNLVRRYVTSFEKLRLRIGAESLNADLLGQAEAFATKGLADNGPTVRKMRRNLRHHPPRDTTRDNREDVLHGALTNQIRLMSGEMPEDRDSILELMHAIGMSGLVEVAPGAVAAVAGNGAQGVTDALAKASFGDLVATADRASAMQLRACVAMMLPLLRALGRLPEQLRYFVGLPEGVVFDATNPELLAVMLTLWTRLLDDPDTDPAPVVDALVTAGFMTTDEGRVCVRAAASLRDGAATT